MLALALMFFLQVGPQPAAPPPEAVEIVGPYIFREDQGQTTKVILKNGLTVIVRKQHAVPLASVLTYVKAGYFNEEDRVTGISHVIEHMFFKGTATRPVGEIARETKALGGYLNAYTFYDRTVYHTVVPAESTLEALDIQADALWRSTFDAEELKREIEVVLQENNRKLDNPPAVTSEKLYSVAFEQHRMRRWRIGTAEGLRALTRNDIVDYYNRYYIPSNIILVVVGQVDRERVLDEIVKLYGDAATPAPEAPPVAVPAPVTPPSPEAAVEIASLETVDTGVSPPEPEQAAVRYGWQRGSIEQSHIALGFHTPGILSPEARALEVLASILGHGRASRLNQYVRDEKGLITSGSAALHAFRDFGFFEINAQTDTPLEAQIGILAELENIRQYGVTNEAVARAKTSIAQGHFHQLETVDGVAEELAFHEAFGDWKNSAAYLSEIQTVTAQRVMNAATLFSENNLSAFEYVPDSVTRNFSTADYRAAVLDKVSAATEERSEQELADVAEIPVVDESVTHDLIKPIQRRSILRGPDVYILEDHRLPLVSFGIFYPGGRLYESSENAGITELMLRTALRGTRRYNSADIARRLENAGAQIRVVNEADFFGYIVEGLSGNMEQALEILIDVLQQPEFDEQEIEREKMLQQARIKNLRENNYSYPVSLFMETLFGDYPYARPAIGSATSIQAITKGDLEGWFRQNQRLLMPLVLIVGDTSGTGLVASLADPLTNEDLQERDILSLPSPEWTSDRRERVETVERQQTALVYGFPGVSSRGGDRHALAVFANIVSGLGGRFFDAIREKQGLAYTVNTSNAFFTRSGAVFTYTAFSPEKEAEVRTALDNEFEKLRTGGVSAEEVRKAIAYSVGEHEIRLQSRQSLVLEYARAVYSGAGPAAVSRYGEQIRAVTPAQIGDVLGLYLTPDQLRVAIVRGTSN